MMPWARDFVSDAYRTAKCIRYACEPQPLFVAA